MTYADIVDEVIDRLHEKLKGYAVVSRKSVDIIMVEWPKVNLRIGYRADSYEIRNLNMNDEQKIDVLYEKMCSEIKQEILKNFGLGV